MIIAFFGHRNFQMTDYYRKKVLHYLEEKVGDRKAEMYLGGYGNFDLFAYECCKEYRFRHPKTTLIFVTPYLTESYQKNNLKEISAIYDCILYPPIEEKPPRFAIKYRNMYMVEKADCVIAYIKHKWGGAYQAYLHAIRSNKEIFNLSDKIK